MNQLMTFQYDNQVKEEIFVNLAKERLSHMKGKYLLSMDAVGKALLDIAAEHEMIHSQDKIFEIVKEGVYEFLGKEEVQSLLIEMEASSLKNKITNEEALKLLGYYNSSLGKKIKNKYENLSSECVNAFNENAKEVINDLVQSFIAQMHTGFFMTEDDEISEAKIAQFLNEGLLSKDKVDLDTLSKQEILSSLTQEEAAEYNEVLNSKEYKIVNSKTIDLLAVKDIDIEQATKLKDAFVDFAKKEMVFKIQMTLLEQPEDTVMSSKQKKSL